MINLLPPQYKENIIYARKNRALLNWTLAMIASLLILVAIIVSGYILMNNSIKTQQSRTSEARQRLKEQKIDETKAKLDEVSSNTKLILQVLSREILFSKLLRQLGASFPPGTTLQSIQIDKVEGGITLRALAKNVQSATQIQVNLSDPENKIFQKADIESIDCSAAGSEDPTQTRSAYPCAVQLRALFSTDNPYVYISDTAKSSGATSQ